MQKGDRIIHDKQMKINMPKKLGLFTKDYFGTEVHIGRANLKPKFDKAVENEGQNNNG